ncbi:MAG: oligosaccharide flippase family protein [Methanotrichaceae archaeon]|nr:oligosaccharide flippase family protein [Methanotrichaceae archaeon]
MRHSFAADVLTLASGTVIAQAIAIIALPILTRLYTPDTFGLLALFLSITSIISVVACLRYELSIMLPVKDEDATSLLVLSLLLAALTSLTIAVLIWLSGGALLQALNAPALEPYMWLVPIAVFLSGCYLAFNYWSSRSKRFRRISTALMANSISQTGIQLAAGLVGYATTGSLIIAVIFGSAFSTSILGGQVLRNDRKIIRENVTLNGMERGFKKYKKFPMMDMWSALLNTASWQLPSFLLTAFFSTTIVGFYALCMRVLYFPMNLIGSSIAQVFFQRASEAKHEGSLDHLFENVLSTLVGFSLFPMLMLALVGEQLFGIVFGATWSEAGVYAQILALWAFVWFISSPLSTVYIVLERQEIGLRVSIANFVTRFIALLVGGLMGDPLVAITLFAIAGLSVYSYMLLILTHHAGVSNHKLMTILFSNFKLFIPAGLIVVILKVFAINPIAIVVVSGILTLGYFLFFVKNDPYASKLLEDVRTMIQKG